MQTKEPLTNLRGEPFEVLEKLYFHLKKIKLESSLTRMAF